VSETPEGPLFESGFLRQSDLGLFTAFPDGEAVEIARRERPRLIIEDLESSKRAGLDFCHRLADEAATRSIPLILVAPDELVGDARATHAKLVLSKPLQPDEFFDAVRRFVPLPHRRVQRVSINLRFTYTARERVAQAFSRDLSSHGAFLKTDRILPLGTRLDLKFCIPGVDERVRCHAVVRGTSSSRGEPGGIGIEFEDLTDRDRKRLEAFMDHHADHPILPR
jgi:uncharacterized protein (TIGR02266 family)